MQLDFDRIERIGEYTPAPEGLYRCRVADIKEEQTSRGYPMWRLRLEIEDGEHAGCAIFDRLAFNPATLPPAMWVCQYLGVDTTGRLDLMPEMLVARRFHVRARDEGYLCQDGETRSGSTVPSDGDASVSDGVALVQVESVARPSCLSARGAGARGQGGSGGHRAEDTCRCL